MLTRSEHSNVPEPVPTAERSQRPDLRYEDWTTPDPDMILIYWMQKLNVLHGHLAAQANELLMEGS